MARPLGDRGRSGSTPLPPYRHARPRQRPRRLHLEGQPEAVRCRRPSGRLSCPALGHPVDLAAPARDRVLRPLDRRPPKGTLLSPAKGRAIDGLRAGRWLSPVGKPPAQTPKTASDLGGRGGSRTPDICLVRGVAVQAGWAATIVSTAFRGPTRMSDREYARSSSRAGTSVARRPSAPPAVPGPPKAQRTHMRRGWDSPPFLLKLGAASHPASNPPGQHSLGVLIPFRPCPDRGAEVPASPLVRRGNAGDIRDPAVHRLQT